MIWICPGYLMDFYFPPPPELEATHLGEGLWWYIDQDTKLMTFWEEQTHGLRRVHFPCGHVNTTQVAKCAKCKHPRFRDMVDKPSQVV